MFFYVTAAFLIVLVILWTVYRKMKDGEFVPVVVEALYGFAIAVILMLSYCAVITSVFTEETDVDTETYTVQEIDGAQGAYVQIDMRADGDRGRVVYMVEYNGYPPDRSRPGRLVNIVESDTAKPTVAVHSYSANHPLWWPFGSTSNFEDTYTLTVPTGTVDVRTDR